MAISFMNKIGKSGITTYPTLDDLNAVTGTDGEIANIVDNTNTYLGTYKYNGTTSVWEEVVTPNTVTPTEYNIALATAKQIKGGDA